MSAADHLAPLWAKIDAFTARVAARYPGELACRAGCDDCCKRALTVTAIEAAAVSAAVRGADAAVRARLAERAQHPLPSRCVALEDDGRCAVYGARPVVCRSHGLALRFEEPTADPARRSLPIIDACHKNFTSRAPATLDPDCILDQTTLSTLVAALDAARSDAHGTERGQRTALADVILAACALPSPG
jgi:hypothetical protein